MARLKHLNLKAVMNLVNGIRRISIWLCNRVFEPWKSGNSASQATRVMDGNDGRDGGDDGMLLCLKEIHEIMRI